MRDPWSHTVHGAVLIAWSIQAIQQTVSRSSKPVLNLRFNNCLLCHLSSVITDSTQQTFHKVALLKMDWGIVVEILGDWS